MLILYDICDFTFFGNYNLVALQAEGSPRKTNQHIQ